MNFHGSSTSFIYTLEANDKPSMVFSVRACPNTKSYLVVDSDSWRPLNNLESEATRSGAEFSKLSIEVELEPLKYYSA